MIAKRGLRDYWLLAPSLERADPHLHRLIDEVFYTTDATSLWFDTQNELGLELGADFRRNSSKLTRDNGKGQSAAVSDMAAVGGGSPRASRADPRRGWSCSPRVAEGRSSIGSRQEQRSARAQVGFL